MTRSPADTVKHTPGPWRATKCHDDFNITYNEAGNWLATVFDDDDPVDGRTEADARLIAAAPDLLAELIQAEAFIAGFEGDELQEGINHLLSGIRAAIARAEGRSDA